jgi:YQGE family putative transporter
MHKQIQLKNLITITILFTIGMVLSDVFVNIYIWRLKNNFMLLSIYLMGTYAVIPIVFYANSFIARKTDRVNIYRVGIFLYAAFYLSVIILNQKVTDYLLLVGALKGLAMGFYWFGYHILTLDYTGPENRDRFYSLMTIVSGVSSLIAPPAAGYMIVKMGGFIGYNVIFTVTSVLFIAAAILSAKLKSEPVDHPYKIKDLIFTKDAKWKGVLWSYFFLTARDAITTFLFAVLIVKVTKSEFKFGEVAVLFSGITIISAWIMSKYSRPGNREKFILSGALIQFFAALVLLYKIDFGFLVLQGLLQPIGDNLVRIPLSAYSMDVIAEKDPKGTRKMEYIVTRDLPIAAGRIIMMIIFMVLIQYLPETGLKIIIFLISLCPFGVWLAIKSKPARTSGQPPITVSEA